jgi:hypothetical protein
MVGFIDAKIHAIAKLEVGGGRSELRFIQLSQVVPAQKSMTVNVTVSSSVNPSSAGQGVFFTATLSDTTATGLVNFTSDGSPIGGGQIPVANGIAVSGSVSTLAAGTHTIVAHYLGDSKFPAASGMLTQTVDQAITKVHVYGQPNPFSSDFGGQQPAFTIFMEVQDLNGNILTSATSTFALRYSIDNGATFQPVNGGSAISISAGKANFPTFLIGQRDYIFRAIYHGDSNFATSRADFTELFRANTGNFPTNFTLSGTGSIQLQSTYTYTLTAPNNFTGQVEIWIPSSFVTEFHFGGAIAWSGTPGVTNGVSNYPIIVNMVNGSVTFALRAFGGVSLNYGSGDFATGYVDVAVLNPAGGPSPTINNQQFVQLTVL